MRARGCSRTITKLEFALQQLVEKSTEGNLRALQQLLALVRTAEDRTPLESNEAPLGHTEQKVLQGILQRFAKSIPKEGNRENSSNDERSTS